MPVRFDLDIPDDDAAYLASLAERQGTTPERLLADWLTAFFSGDESVVRERVANLLASKRPSDLTSPTRASEDG